MVNCVLCGKCCYYKTKHGIKRCHHLVKLGEKNICRIYKKRLGTMIYEKDGQKVICMDRIESKQIVEGCPYNELIKSE